MQTMFIFPCSSWLMALVPKIAYGACSQDSKGRVCNDEDVLGRSNILSQLNHTDLKKASAVKKKTPKHFKSYY